MNKIVLFWSNWNNENSVDEWVNKKLEFSSLHALTLFSLSKYKENQIELWTYNSVSDDFPFKNIKIYNAHSVLSANFAFKSLKMGSSIVHISDIIRLKIASLKLGIVLDMDAVQLRPFPNIHGFYATMPAKKTGGVAPKWGKSHPPFIIRNNSWDGRGLSAFPIKVSYLISNDINELSNKIINRLHFLQTNKSSKSWNDTLWTIKNIANKDKISNIFPPEAFCPLPAWLGKGKCYSTETPSRLTGAEYIFGHKLPSEYDILEKSYIVQHFFESEFKGAEKKRVSDFWLNLNENCLLSKEAEKVVGHNWRNVLTDIQNKF